MINFILYSAILLLLPFGIVILIILQILSDRSSSPKRSDCYTTILLYSIYISGLCCGIIGFSLHFSTSIHWCEKYGLLPCFTLLGASKAVLYAFFLRRAKLAHGITGKCIKYLFSYIAPIYLFVYWLAYCVLTSVLFTVRFTPHIAVSNCTFDEWALWFCILAACIDVFNCVSLLVLLFYPLFTAIRKSKILRCSHASQSQVDRQNHMIRLQFIALMKWNVCLTVIASITSITTLFMVAVTDHYVWLFCLGDPFVNSLCTFFMTAMNRRYIVKLCSTKWRIFDTTEKEESTDAETSNAESEITATTATATATATARMTNFTLDDWMHHHLQLSRRQTTEYIPPAKDTTHVASPDMEYVPHGDTADDLTDLDDFELPQWDDLAVSNRNDTQPNPSLIVTVSNVQNIYK